MKPKKTNFNSQYLFKPEISSYINPQDPLKVLADKIDWDFFDKELSVYYKSGAGYPPKPIRLMVSLIMLQHMHNLSDEKVVEFWLSSPYWQYFSGNKHMQWHNPVSPSSLSSFRKRIGEDGIQIVLQGTIIEAVNQGAIKKKPR